MDLTYKRLNQCIDLNIHAKVYCPTMREAKDLCEKMADLKPPMSMRPHKLKYPYSLVIWTTIKSNTIEDLLGFRGVALVHPALYEDGSFIYEPEIYQQIIHVNARHKNRIE